MAASSGADLQTSLSRLRGGTASRFSYRLDCFSFSLSSFYDTRGGEQNFLNFRAWLISKGKDVFTKALENPDSLHEILDAENREDASYELFSYVAAKAFRTKTGGKQAPFSDPYAGTPHGKGLDATQTIQEAFPNLYSKLGECPEY